MISPKYVDLILGALLIPLSLALIFVVVPIGVDLPGANTNPILSPVFWIDIITWSMFAIGLLLVAHGMRRARLGLTASEARDLAFHAEHHLSAKPATTRAVASVGLMFVYYVLIELIGIVAASALAIVALVLLGGERRWYIALPLAVLLPVALYYFFLKVAGIPMPLGVFDS